MRGTWPWRDRLAYGADYNPEQWPDDVHEQDVDLMVAAGVNLVTLPVFGWAALEPRPDEYEFGQLDRTIDLLWSREISVDLATATASPPAWLVRQHPEVLPVTADGVRLEFGSRQTYCPSSPVFRERAAALCRQLAQHYRDHPAVALWHVSNEYGDELARCYCEISAEQFRSWLQQRYRHLAGLNEAWATEVWGQRYGDWSEIAPPRRSAAPVNPAQRLDFERFSSDALRELFAAEVAVLREECPDVPVTTNFMGLCRAVDYWRMAELEDVVSNDTYPDPGDPESHVSAALGYSAMRSFGCCRPWLLMEQAPSAVSWRDVNLPKPPGRMRLGSLQALAHGADGIMFFQWRASRAGAERFHSALVGHRGAEGRTWAECRALGAELQRLGEVTGSRVVADVGLVAGWDSWWALDCADSLPSSRLSWLEQVRVWHAALFRLGATVDLVDPDSQLASPPPVIVAPSLFLVTPQQARRLRDYVEAGGHLVVGPFSGVVDAADAVHPGGAPGPLRDLLGVEVDEWVPLPDIDRIEIEFHDAALTAVGWAESLVAVTASVEGTYRSGWLAGQPAVTLSSIGAGTATYISSVPTGSGLEVLLRPALERGGLSPREDVSADLELVRRRGDRAEYLFALNHGAHAADIKLPGSGLDLLSGRPVADNLALPPDGAVVIRTPRVTEQEVSCD